MDESEGNPSAEEVSQAKELQHAKRRPQAEGPGFGSVAEACPSSIDTSKQC